MNLLTKPVLYVLAAIAIAAGVFATMQTLRLSAERLAHAQTKSANARVLADINDKAQAALVAVRAAERAHAAEISDIMSQNQKDLEHAQDQYEADLRAMHAGTLQLQKRWRCPAGTNVPGAVASPGVTADADADRQESAARAVRAADQCDAQNAALIKIVIADREICNGK